MAKYIWAKNKLSTWILEIINNEVNNFNYSFADLFAWTWAIWKKAKEYWYKIISNDLQYYSYIMNYWNVTINSLDKNIDNIIDSLNNLDWIKGFIFEHFSEKGSDWRLYFSENNWKKIDAIRLKIEELLNCKTINKETYNYLLYLLLLEVNKVSNTTSVFSSYLKKIKDTAKNEIKLSKTIIIDNKQINEIYNEDVNVLINKNIKFDIVYLDPPYNWRQYSKSYHLLETISKYDNPILKGVTWKRNTEDQLSNYSKKTKINKSFYDLINDIDCKHLFLSYNNEGILTKKEILNILKQYWKVQVFEKTYKRYKSNNNNQKSKNVIEYLFHLNKEQFKATSKR